MITKFKLFEYRNDFNSWFKKSKVIDKDGNPLVVYHGTNKDFECFDEDKQCENFKVSDLGYYFTNAPIATYNSDFVFGSTASEYAYNSQKKGYNSLDGANILPVYLKIEKPLYIEADGWYSDVAAIDKQQNDIKRWLKDGDYDGIISKYSKDSEDYIPNITYVVFKPNQIKSAIGNNGKYSNNNKITETYNNDACSNIYIYIDDENIVREYIENNCDMNIRIDDRSLLIAAASVRNNINVVRMLIEAGADWCHKDKLDYTFMDYLSHPDSRKIMKEYPDKYEMYLMCDNLEKFNI